jgi:hypothetical protein
VDDGVVAPDLKRKAVERIGCKVDVSLRKEAAQGVGHLLCRQALVGVVLHAHHDCVVHRVYLDETHALRLDSALVR